MDNKEHRSRVESDDTKLGVPEEAEESLSELSRDEEKGMEMLNDGRMVRSGLDSTVIRVRSDSYSSTGRRMSVSSEAGAATMKSLRKMSEALSSQFESSGRGGGISSMTAAMVAKRRHSMSVVSSEMLGSLEALKSELSDLDWLTTMDSERKGSDVILSQSKRRRGSVDGSIDEDSSVFLNHSDRDRSAKSSAIAAAAVSVNNETDSLNSLGSAMSGLDRKPRADTITQALLDKDEVIVLLKDRYGVLLDLVQHISTDNISLTAAVDELEAEKERLIGETERLQAQNEQLQDTEAFLNQTLESMSEEQSRELDVHAQKYQSLEEKFEILRLENEQVSVLNGEYERQLKALREELGHTETQIMEKEDEWQVREDALTREKARMQDRLHEVHHKILSGELTVSPETLGSLFDDDGGDGGEVATRLDSSSKDAGAGSPKTDTLNAESTDAANRSDDSSSMKMKEQRIIDLEKSHESLMQSLKEQRRLVQSLKRSKARLETNVENLKMKTADMDRQNQDTLTYLADHEELLSAMLVGGPKVMGKEVELYENIYDTCKRTRTFLGILDPPPEIPGAEQFELTPPPSPQAPPAPPRVFVGAPIANDPIPPQIKTETIIKVEKETKVVTVEVPNKWDLEMDFESNRHHSIESRTAEKKKADPMAMSFSSESTGVSSRDHTEPKRVLIAAPIPEVKVIEKKVDTSDWASESTGIEGVCASTLPNSLQFSSEKSGMISQSGDTGSKLKSKKMELSVEKSGVSGRPSEILSEKQKKKEEVTLSVMNGEGFDFESQSKKTKKEGSDEFACVTTGVLSQTEVKLPVKKMLDLDLESTKVSLPSLAEDSSSSFVMQKSTVMDKKPIHTPPPPPRRSKKKRRQRPNSVAQPSLESQRLILIDFFSRYSEPTNWKCNKRTGVDMFYLQLADRDPIQARMSFLYAMTGYLSQMVGIDKRCLSHAFILLKPKSYQVESLAKEFKLILETLGHHDSDKLWKYVYSFLFNAMGYFKHISHLIGTRTKVRSPVDARKMTLRYLSKSIVLPEPSSDEDSHPTAAANHPRVVSSAVGSLN